MKTKRNKAILRVGKMLLIFVLGASLMYLPVAAQEDPVPAPAAPNQKSEALAFSLSLYGTVLPVLVSLALSNGILGVIGLFIGPSLGYFYAGLPGRASLGIGIRTLAGAVFFVGGAMAFGSLLAGIFTRDREYGNTGAAGTVLALAGAVAFVGSGIWDIYSVKNAVWERNQRFQQKRLSFSPFYIPTSKTVGIQFQFWF